MSAIRRFLPPFIGGEEKTYSISIAEDGVPLDLTGYTLSAEIVWDDCTRITLSEAAGMTVLDYAPPEPASGEDPEPHFSITLSESRTREIPIGRHAVLLLIRVSPSGVTTIRGPIYLERSL